MNPPRPSLHPLLAIAALIVVLAGMRAARSLLMPFLFSIVLAIVVSPIEQWLERRRVPRVFAVLTTVLGVLGILILVATITGQSLQEFTASLQQYQDVFSQNIALVVGWLDALGLDSEALQRGSQGMDPGALVSVVGSTLNGVVDILSDTVLVTITMAFILAEASAFPDKLARAFPEDSDEAERFESFRQLAVSVQRYLFLKSITSGVTGIVVGVWTFSLGLDFFVLWGFLAFILNYIPTIGSIIAAIPAVALALVQLGPGVAIFITVGYLVINVGIGNVLEPRLMGDQLGLSPLVVFVSLVFWGWLWGPAGMLLSVPLTVVVRKVLIHREETRWLAVLLGPNRTLRLTPGRPRLTPD